MPRGQALAAYLNLRADALPARQYALLRVLETQDGKVMGGITYIVIDLDNKEQENEQGQEQHSPEEQPS